MAEGLQDQEDVLAPVIESGGGHLADPQARLGHKMDNRPVPLAPSPPPSRYPAQVTGDGDSLSIPTLRLV